MANITTQTIRVDLSTGKIIPTAYTHQNDTARTFIFDMYNGGLPYTMTGNTVKFAYKSPIVDGQYSVIAGSSMASGTVSGNKVTVTLPSEYTAISGVGMLTMIITPTSGTVRPVNIRLVVQKSADGANELAGASDFPTTIEGYVNDWMDENATPIFGETTHPDLEQGSFGFTDGTITYSANSKRCRTPENTFLTLEEGDMISTTGDVVVSGAIVGSSGERLDGFTWTQDYTIETSGQYALVLQHDGYTETITPEVAEAALSIYKPGMLDIFINEGEVFD